MMNYLCDKLDIPPPLLQELEDQVKSHSKHYSIIVGPTMPSSIVGNKVHPSLAHTLVNQLGAITATTNQPPTTSCRTKEPAQWTCP